MIVSWIGGRRVDMGLPRCSIAIAGLLYYSNFPALLRSSTANNIR